MKLALAVSIAFLGAGCSAQMQHLPSNMAAKPAPIPSTTLTVTGLGGKVQTLEPEAFAKLPHVTVHVHNAHTNSDESYSGLPVQDLLKLAKDESTPQTSTNMQVVVAGATDNFHVVLTLCDTNPDCRSGQAIVADLEDGKPLATDGAFKLILTEDKKPARWVRNLQSLTVKAVSVQ